MKLALAQLSMEKDLEKNAAKSLRFCDEAKDCDLLFFPEIQLSPFFPQYEKQNADAGCFRDCFFLSKSRTASLLSVSQPVFGTAG